MREKTIHRIFEISVLLKGAHALLEIASGIALYLFKTETLVALMLRYGRGELLEDPRDLLANRLLDFARTFSVEAHHFFAFYLLSHGIIKAVLVAGLLREKLWAYPASLAVFGAFIAYQLYRFSYTNDLLLIVLSAFDLVVIYLAWHEYRLLKRHLPTH